MTRPTRPPANNHLIMLGKWVCEQAALGRMSWHQVNTTYEETGMVWPTSNVQIAKLRVFYRFGRKHKAHAMLWLAGWREHQYVDPKTGIKWGQYETMLREIRKQL